MIPVISPIHSIASCDAIWSESRDRFKADDFDVAKDRMVPEIAEERTLSFLSLKPMAQRAMDMFKMISVRVEWSLSLPKGKNAFIIIAEP